MSTAKITMATISDTDSLAKKRSRQDSSDPETNCQKCDKTIKDKIMCQGCKLDYCLACAKITPTMFECMVQGEMEDFIGVVEVVEQQCPPWTILLFY